MSGTAYLAGRGGGVRGLIRGPADFRGARRHPPDRQEIPCTSPSRRCSSSGSRRARAAESRPPSRRGRWPRRGRGTGREARCPPGHGQGALAPHRDHGHHPRRPPRGLRLRPRRHPERRPDRRRGRALRPRLLGGAADDAGPLVDDDGPVPHAPRHPHQRRRHPLRRVRHPRGGPAGPGLQDRRLRLGLRDHPDLEPRSGLRQLLRQRGRHQGLPRRPVGSGAPGGRGGG